MRAGKASAKGCSGRACARLIASWGKKGESVGVHQRPALLQEALEISIVRLVVLPVGIHQNLVVQCHWLPKIDGLRYLLLCILGDVPQLSLDDPPLALRPNHNLLAERQLATRILTPHRVDDCHGIWHLLPQHGEEFLARDFRRRHARRHVAHSLHGVDGALPWQVLAEPELQGHEGIRVIKNRGWPQILQQGLALQIHAQILCKAFPHRHGELLDVNVPFSEEVDFVEHHMDLPLHLSELPQEGKLLVHLRVQPPMVPHRRANRDPIELGTRRHEVPVHVALPGVDHPPQRLHITRGLPCCLDHGLVELACAEQPLGTAPVGASLLLRLGAQLHDAGGVHKDRLRARLRPRPG
mmetsp:Transcript_32665/g.90146  ORF Transcript_32665/g.90146 Transcript_32665/m.90146 type:complete len:354 (-) Transcript_32665:663-1724(-)